MAEWIKQWIWILGSKFRKHFSNDLYLEAFLTALELINQTCDILNIHSPLFSSFLSEWHPKTLSIKPKLSILLVIFRLNRLFITFPGLATFFVVISQVLKKFLKISLILKIINLLWQKSR